jgi:putative heme degradation protein
MKKEIKGQTVGAIGKTMTLVVSDNGYHTESGTLVTVTRAGRGALVVKTETGRRLLISGQWV